MNHNVFPGSTYVDVARSPPAFSGLGTVHYQCCPEASAVRPGIKELRGDKAPFGPPWQHLTLLLLLLNLWETLVLRHSTWNDIWKRQTFPFCNNLSAGPRRGWDQGGARRAQSRVDKGKETRAAENCKEH